MASLQGICLHKNDWMIAGHVYQCNSHGIYQAPVPTHSLSKLCRVLSSTPQTWKRGSEASQTASGNEHLVSPDGGKRVEMMPFALASHTKPSMADRPEEGSRRWTGGLYSLNSFMQRQQVMYQLQWSPAVDRHNPTPLPSALMLQAAMMIWQAQVY